MNRREVIALVSSALVLSSARSSTSRAQQKRSLPRIGMLWHAANEQEEAVWLSALRQGLGLLGYIEGRNFVLEQRFPAEQPDLFRSFAVELAQLDVEILLAAGTPPALALQRATTKVPIVFIAVFDPVRSGLVDNLARPSSNITGLASPDLIEKRLEIFKEAAPGLSRVALLLNVAVDPTSAHTLIARIIPAANDLGLALEPIMVNGAGDLERAFSAITRTDGMGVTYAADVMFYIERKRLAELAMSLKLPMMANNVDFAKAGALMSYGPNVSEMFRRAGHYVDKILKGAKPADLPVEQPTRFQFAVNLKMARRPSAFVYPQPSSPAPTR